MLTMTYPARITPTEDHYHIVVPQFNIIQDSKTPDGAIQKAKEQICIHLASCVDTGGEIPAAEPIGEAENGSSTAMISIDMAAYMRDNGKKKVRKNVYIPAWLETVAEKQGVNFSRTLQAALLTSLGYNSAE